MPRKVEEAVAATRVEAIHAGERALASGGNAVDAAVAASFALAVVEPYMTGPGAVGELLYLSPDGECTVLDAAARAPTRATADMFEVIGSAPVVSPVDYSWPPVRGRRNEVGFTAATAPRLVEGLGAVHEELGALPWSSLVLPAVELAATRLDLDFFTAALIADAMPGLAEDPLARRLYYPAGRPLRAPLFERTLIPPNLELARTLQTIAAKGGRALRGGTVAEAIVGSVQAAGGLLSHDDLRIGASVLRRVEPLESFRGWSIFGSPLPSGATTAAHVLALIAGRPPDTSGPFSTTRFVNSAGAVRDAVRLRSHELSGDDGIGDVSRLLAGARSAGIPNEAPLGVASHGRNGTTTHVSVADRDGGVVALTLTLLKTFGCQRSVDGCGFFLNNGMWWFDPVPGRRQSIAPGARALSAVAPLIAVDPSAGRRIAIGGLGARPIFASVAQALESMIDYGLGAEEAIDHPRAHSDGTNIYVDQRLPADVVDRLETDVGPVVVVPYSPISLTNARLTVVDTAPPRGAPAAAVDARARATYDFGLGGRLVQ